MSDKISDFQPFFCPHIVHRITLGIPLRCNRITHAPTSDQPSADSDFAMTHGFVEHVNITVGSPEKTATMLTHLFGWHHRWAGPSGLGGRTIHVGTDTHYIAMYATEDADGSALSHAKGRPLNHIGIVVDDLNAVEQRAIALGMTPFNHGDYAPGRRFYLLDADNIEWEIISYSG
jgi:glyoxylase I family protein